MGTDFTVSSWFGITPLASGLHGLEVPGRPSGHISRIHRRGVKVRIRRELHDAPYYYEGIVNGIKSFCTDIN